MASTDWTFPSAVTGTGWAASDGGTLVDAVGTDQDDIAAVHVSPASTYLICADFPWTVPANAVIEGIETKQRCYFWPDPISQGIPPTYPYIQIRLSKDGTNPVSSEREHLIDNRFPPTPPGDSPMITEGSASDLWGTTWTEAEVNAPSFAVLIKTGTSSAETPSQGRAVNVVMARVHYSEPVINPLPALMASQHKRIPDIGAIRNKGAGVRKN